MTEKLKSSKKVLKSIQNIVYISIISPILEQLDQVQRGFILHSFYQDTGLQNVLRSALSALNPTSHQTAEQITQLILQ